MFSDVPFSQLLVFPGEGRPEVIWLRQRLNKEA